MIKINGEVISIGKFPNGEIHIEKERIIYLVRKNMVVDYTKRIHIAVTFKYEDDSDLIHLMFIKAELDRLYPAASKILYIAYMPYSRMDRENDVYIFTLKYISNFINSLKFEAITVEEPHSDVCLALLDNCNAIYVTKDYLDEVTVLSGFDRKKDYLFFPDAGAQKRYSDLKDFKTLVGYKERDMGTGRITKYEVIGNIEEGSKIIILDDLSSK
jgi:ribose-phosphate pyrophosphokinase